MGFRKGAWMSVFGFYPNEKSDKVAQISGATSIKNKTTGEYATDFSAYCTCIGEAAVKKAKALKIEKGKPARIRLQDIEVRHTFEGEGADRKLKYVNYNIYDFDFGDEETPAKPSRDDELEAAYEGLSDDPNEEGLPF
ncbi:MAG: hypothetical protein LIR46_13260 [Bacteroidota bacterium]|nr:hypothetical protein [Bacteroidota bacterium]